MTALVDAGDAAALRRILESPHFMDFVVPPSVIERAGPEMAQVLRSLSPEEKKNIFVAVSRSDFPAVINAAEKVGADALAGMVDHTGRNLLYIGAQDAGMMALLRFVYGVSAATMPDGKTLLFYACRHTTEAINLCVWALGVDPNAVSKYQTTALIELLQMKGLVMGPKLCVLVDALARAGADVKKDPTKRRAPLGIAAQTKRLDVAEVLVNYGATFSRTVFESLFLKRYDERSSKRSLSAPPGDSRALDSFVEWARHKGAWLEDN